VWLRPLVPGRGRRGARRERLRGLRLRLLALTRSQALYGIRLGA